MTLLYEKISVDEQADSVHEDKNPSGERSLSPRPALEEAVIAMCAHCKQSLYRQLPHGDLMHVSGLKTCRKGSGVYGAERIETAAASLLLSEECKAITLQGEDWWAIPRDVYDELRAMLEDWPK